MTNETAFGLGEATVAEWWGAVILFLVPAIVLAVPYIACLVIIFLTKSLFESSSYKLMFVIGLNDMIQLFCAGPLCGIYVLGNITTDLQTRFAGAVMMLSYKTYYVLTILLAVERCVKTWWPTSLWQSMFGNGRLNYIMLLCLAYGVGWFVMFSFTDLFRAFFTLQKFTWTYTTNGQASNVAKILAIIPPLMTVGILIASYTLIGINLRMKLKSTSNAGNMKRELKLFYMCACIAGSVLTTELFWFFGFSAIIPYVGIRWALILNELIWVLNSGINGIIYITFNETIREELKRFWKVGISGRSTQVIPIGN